MISKLSQLQQLLACLVVDPGMELVQYLEQTQLEQKQVD